MKELDKFRPCALLCACAFVLYAGFAEAGQQTVRVSESTDGGEPDQESRTPVISRNGRYVAFSSAATDLLIPADSSGFYDIFVWDRITRTIERVSLTTEGGEPNNGSYEPSISADGRYVAFQSNATDLAGTGQTTLQDIFVRDRTTGTTELVSVKYGTAADEPGGSSYDPSISDDGRYVAFESSATDLLSTADTSSRDIFVRDRQAAITERISVSAAGGIPDGNSYSPSISADGRYVAFESYASNLLDPPDSFNNRDIFVRDRQEGTTERISVNISGEEPNNFSSNPDISADGRYVSFSSYATDLVASDTNNSEDIFVYDRLNKTTELISVNSNGEQQNNSSGYGAALSADGRYVAFTSYATNLVDDDTNLVLDLFRRDREKGITIRSSVNTAGEEQDAEIYYDNSSFDISGNGQYLVFQSKATNLADPQDISSMYDIFLREEEKEPPSWLLFLPSVIHQQEK